MPKWNILLCILLWICPGFVYMGAVTLTSNARVHAPCNGSLSLACSVATGSQLSRIIMGWVSLEEGELCKLTDRKIHHQSEKIQCQYDSERLTLTLVLLDARPWDHKTYHCKMRSNLGIGYTNTTVLPTVCEGSFQHTALQNPPQEECLFYDVFPESNVVWFSDDKNLTASSVDNKILQGASGLYNISSVFPRGENITNLSCKLSSHRSSYAIPSRENLRIGASHDIITSTFSSSSCTGLHWVLFFTGLMLSQWE